MSGIDLKLEVELDALNRNVAALAAMTKKTAAETVKTITVWALQTGAKETPQVGERAKTRDGRKITTKREILRAVRRYRRNVEELAVGEKPSAPGDKALFLIQRPRNRRPIGKTGGRKFWSFESLAEAKAHQEITYRGIGKAGFWSQFPALGLPVPKGYAKQMHLMNVPGIAMTVVNLSAEAPAISVSNTVRGISGYLGGARLDNLIVSRINNRIGGYAKTQARKLATFKRAGGVVWDRESETYQDIDSENILPF